MNQEKRNDYNLKQLNIEVPQEILTQIKMASAQRNIPMKTWILRQIIRGLKEEFRG